MMAGIIAPYGLCPLRGVSYALSVTHSAVVNNCKYNVTWLKRLSQLCLLRIHLDRFSLYGAVSE